MSNVSIYEKNWTDLVFEDKNKAYGAYQLRQENPRTSLFAFLGGVALIFSIIGGWFVLSSFGNSPDGEIIAPDEPTVVLVDYTPPPASPQPEKPNMAPPQAPSGSESENEFKKYVASKEPDTNIEVPKNTDIDPKTNGAGDGPDKGPAIDVPTVPTSPGIGYTPPINTPVSPKELDRLPQYPGTMKKFYEFVANNFEKPETDDISSMNVVMSFVIEKDGTMTDIKVVRSSDKSVEKEAIRVLKSMKVKWEPGYKDGQKMRTQFMLPIRVAF